MTNALQNKLCVLSRHNKGEREREKSDVLPVVELCEAIILSVDAMLTGRGQISALEKPHPSIRPSRKQRSLGRFPQTHKSCVRVPPDSHEQHFNA